MRGPMEWEYIIKRRRWLAAPAQRVDGYCLFGVVSAVLPRKRIHLGVHVVVLLE